MKLSASTAATYAAMLSKLLPRGPIWDGAQAALGALLTALGAELNEVHARLVQVIEEAFPNTADETLADWLRVWALPGPCSTMPATDDGKRELLAGKVAAQGGQSRAYYIGIVRAILGDLTASVIITERPYGNVFRAWSGRAWDPVNGTGLAHHWRVTLPSGTTPSQVDAVDCVLQAYKPAHTVLEVVGLVSAYYESPGGAGDYLEASTALAARVFFAGAGAPTEWSFGFWVRRTIGTADEVPLFGVSDEANPGYEQNFSAVLFDPGFGDGISNRLSGDTGALSFSSTPMPDMSAWTRLSWAFDGSILRAYVDGVEDSNDTDTFTWAEGGAVFILLASFALDQGPEADIRNILINNRAHSADEEAALYAAGKSHDLRAPYGDDWAGETPPIYWCRSALPGGRVTHWYQVEAGETLSATGFSSLPDPEDAALSFWFQIPSVPGDDDAIIFREDGEAGIEVEAGDNDGALFVVRYDSTTEPPTYAVDPVWHLAVLNSDGSEVTLSIDGYEHSHFPVGVALNGNPIFGAVGALYGLSIANIHYWSRGVTPDEIASLYAAGVTHDPAEAFGNWPGMASPVEYVGAASGLNVPNAGTGGAHALTYSGATLVTGLLGTPVGRVPNSGSAGVCDLNLYGSTSSEED